MNQRFRVFDGKVLQYENFFLAHDGTLWERDQKTRKLEQRDYQVDFWTGLVDSDGARIFNNDVLRVKPNNALGKVAWNKEGYWGVIIKKLHYAFASSTDILTSTSKVIGTVYYEIGDTE